MNKKVLIIVVCVMVLVAIGAIVVVNINNKNNDNQNSDVLKEEESLNLTVSYLGVDVTPGVEFSSENIPEEGEYSQIPSCAFQGTDNVVIYSHVEITSAQIDGSERVYSVYFLDDEISTPEGVKITDARADVIDAYGDDFEGNDNKITYVDGKVELSFLIENDVVTSIEYVYVIE